LCPRRLRRGYAWPGHRAGVTPAAVDDAQSRTGRQPPLPSGRRRRRPETVTPRTPTETLQEILARDEAPTSATTLLRELSDPGAPLFDVVQRYTDGLHIAAEQLIGHQIVQMLDGQADQIVPEITSGPSWPTLRAHLLALAAETGEHPLIHLHAAAAGRGLHTAEEMAVVRHWPPRTRTHRPRAAGLPTRHTGSAS
jgi:hypothetical protein